MIKIKDKFLFNPKKKSSRILIDIKEYRKLIKQAEELACIRAYDTAKTSKQEPIPFEQAVKEINRKS